MSRKVHTLYDGQEKLIFESRNHTYSKPNGEILANATGVLKMLSKPAIPGWVGRQTRDYWLEQIEPGVEYDEVQLAAIAEASTKASFEYTNQRRTIGDVIHDWCEQWILHAMGNRKTCPKFPVNNHAKNGVNAFLAWVEEKQTKGGDIEWLFAERLMYHRGNNHVGTADAGYIWPRGVGAPTILDFKTGKNVYAEAGVQAASYAMSAQCEFPSLWTNPERCILHLNTFNGKYSEWHEQRIRKVLTGYDVARDYEFFLSMLNAYRWAAGGPNKWNYLRNS